MGLKISWITIFTYVCDQIQENLASLHSVKCKLFNPSYEQLQPPKYCTGDVAIQQLSVHKHSTNSQLDLLVFEQAFLNFGKIKSTMREMDGGLGTIQPKIFKDFMDFEILENFVLQYNSIFNAILTILGKHMWQRGSTNGTVNGLVGPSVVAIHSPGDHPRQEICSR